MKIGFIGCGNMAQAMIGGLIGSGEVLADDIVVFDCSEEQLSKVNLYNVVIAEHNRYVAVESDVLILAVKPSEYKVVIDEIKDYVESDTIVVSIAAGLSIEILESYFSKDVKLIRTMPNTPSLVGEGMTAIMPNAVVTDDDVSTVCNLFCSFSRSEVISEGLVDAVIASSGSSPAYVFMMIEAMADGAVREGMSREMAYQFSAQAVYGAAKMVIETKMQPAILKDAVCSPNGTTIEAVAELERSGFRASILNAMSVCANKSRKMESREDD